MIIFLVSAFDDDSAVAVYLFVSICVTSLIASLMLVRRDIHTLSATRSSSFTRNVVAWHLILYRGRAVHAGTRCSTTRRSCASRGGARCARVVGGAVSVGWAAAGRARGRRRCARRMASRRTGFESRRFARARTVDLRHALRGRTARAGRVMTRGKRRAIGRIRDPRPPKPAAQPSDPGRRWRFATSRWARAGEGRSGRERTGRCTAQRTVGPASGWRSRRSHSASRRRA